MERDEGRAPIREERGPFKRGSEQCEQTADLRGDDVFVAHAEGIESGTADQEKAGSLGEHDSMIGSREEGAAKLIRLYRTDIHLPHVRQRELSSDESAKMWSWIESLSDEGLVQAIREREQLLERALDGQRPSGLARP